MPRNSYEFTNKKIGLSKPGDVFKMMNYDMTINVLDMYKICGLRKNDAADRDALVSTLIDSGITGVNPDTGEPLPKKYTFMDLEVFLLWQFLIGNIPKYRFYEGMTISPSFKSATPKKFRKRCEGFILDQTRFDEYQVLDRIKKLINDFKYPFAWAELADNFVNGSPRKRFEIMRSFLFNARKDLVREDIHNVIKQEDCGHIFGYYENPAKGRRGTSECISTEAFLPCLIDKTRYKLRYYCGVSTQTIEDVLLHDKERHAKYARQLNSDTFVLPFFTGSYAEKIVSIISR